MIAWIKTAWTRARFTSVGCAGCCILSLGLEQVSAQSLPGSFERFNPWWLNPSNGTGGVTPGAQICIDLDGDSTTESCYSNPTVPAGALTNLQLSPTRRILFAYGSTATCNGSSMVHFFDVPDPPGNLTIIDSACIPFNVNAGQVGFYDTGLCCDGLTDITCSSNLGLDCSPGGSIVPPGTSTQRIAYVADQGDASSQRTQIFWFDLVNRTHATTGPGFNSSLQLTRALVSPYGDVAFVQHDVGGASDSDYTVVDLCAAPRLGDPISSIVGGVLFDLDLPIATAEMIDNGGSYDVRITHPDLTGQMLDLLFTPCSGTPPPVTGACCELTGCSIETSDDCATQGGTWLGPDTVCGDCPFFTLSVNINGPGSVNSNPNGISCPSDCDEQYADGNLVTLTAAANPGAQFVGWSGQCSGTNTSTDVEVNADRKCTATFDVISDLTLSKQDDTDPVIAGMTLGYSISVTNNGPSDATNVTVVDTLPLGVSFDDTASNPSCSASGRIVTCTLGTIGNGENFNLTIGVKVDPQTRGNITNSATVTADGTDPNPTDNLALATTTVMAEADLEVTKTAAPEPVVAGGRLVYTITIINHGPSSATGVTMNDTLPPEVSALADPNNPGQIGCGLGNGNIDVGGDISVSFAVEVNPATSAGTTLTNIVEVSGNEPDSDPLNNIATVDSLVAASVPGPAENEFVLIADTDTAIPGGSGNFTALAGGDKPVLSQGNVAFRGKGVDQDGIYVWINGVLDVVADTGTAIPGGTGTFGNPLSGGFNSPSIDGENVCFGGDDQNITQRGVYSSIGGALGVIADRDTRPPGASTSFSTLGGPSLDGDFVSFWGFVPSNPVFGGIYLASFGDLVTVANETTLIPGGGGRFSGFNPNTQQRRGNVAFFGRNAAFESGLYLYDRGALQRVADSNTPIPGGGGTMNLFFNFMSYDGSSLAFVSHNATLGEPRLFMDDCVGFSTVADFNTDIPCGTGMFTNITDVAIHSGNVAFLGYGDGQAGLYANMGGKIVKIIAALDQLDGKKITAFRFGREGLYGNQAVFTAIFDDGSNGIYLANISTSGVCSPYDEDEDQDHDLFDHAAFEACFSGDGVAHATGCEPFDSDGDGDIDDVDFAEFSNRLTGPLEPKPLEACCLPDGSCMMADPCECEFLRNGTPNSGAVCADDPCVATTGACCSYKGCFVADQQVCNSLSGSFFPGETCASVGCQ